MAGSFIDKNEYEKSASEYRQNHSKDVQKYVKQVYNPIYYDTKPKNRRQMTREELKMFRKTLKALYNFPSKEEYDIFEELGIRRVAET